MNNFAEAMRSDYGIVTHHVGDDFPHNPFWKTACGLEGDGPRKPGAITNVVTEVTCRQCQRILTHRMHKARLAKHG